YAVADGYISRIMVSASGYGKALYVNHPNGYVSVYAHLSRFKKDVEDYIFKYQHDNEEFEINLYPLPNQFKIKKSEIIAKSGNSGRSFGAHLHFEIRETQSEKPINPLLLNFNIEDTIAPKIFSIYMYNFEGENGSEMIIDKKNINGNIIKVFGKIGFGIEAFDFINGRNSATGLYNIDLFVDDSLIFSYTLNKISFFENRYLNIFIDYSERKGTGKKISKCFIEPNNNLSIYEKNKNNGIYDFSDLKTHSVKILAKDVSGNNSSINFNVESDSSFKIKDKKNYHNLKKIYFSKKNFYFTDKIKIIFHLNTLYSDIYLNYYSSKNKFSKYSDIHNIHDSYIALHNKITIAIKPDNLEHGLRKKALIVKLKENNKLEAFDSRWKDGFIETNTSYFGKYFVSIDTIAPKIKSINFNKKNKQNKIIKFKIRDNLSGIETYKGYIDKKWVLFEYDKKTNTIYCNLDKENLKKGKHILKLIVKDKKGNESIFKSNFIY
ncbi:MAG: M23 family metallopeptidase, partial [Bacteroidales bacterium]|nr:M23 family metallopeptidase [Bacteroidales bacterium]